MLAFLKKYAGFLLLLVGVLGLGWLNISQAQAQDRLEIVTTDTTAQTTTVVTTKQATSSNITTASTTKQISTIVRIVVVDVKGEVVNPGVYYLPEGARGIDAINAAGGLSEWADVTHLNQAEVLPDEAMILIPRIESSTPEAITEDDDLYLVDIQGEVINPGVYWLPKGARIIDVIRSAGGQTIRADLTGLNQAAFISDGMRVLIPQKPREIMVEIQGEVLRPGLYLLYETDTLRQLINKAGGFTPYAKIDGLAFDRVLWMGCQMVIPRLEPGAPSGVPDEPESIPEEPSEEIPLLIDINTASLDELMTLSGIGIILGQRIIDYRAEHGDFQTIEDIMRVSGIKESVFSKIQDEITVGDR
ncbi:MAG: SLBB domain-containing protein [Candidatus Izemoplasmatales bacterium]|jgi:competence protein ComEA|nr:SLBB domain-containing protein [Candidatus Izemoplasmatales bacterium]NLF49018.1 hypothetical protein [Acholeplasmataceae bacterium]MDD4354907.1 SLBB domain-containing protein [Candidatus Izemoplasmatales bacterium]MDD4987267.1 SLBB domain-containing protein [Candidatus Izemoplasmatales bacterium]MDD5601492.1 SLBB domain-containing protein [Candidatus Izemoplasmatales bacterium]